MPTSDFCHVFTKIKILKIKNALYVANLIYKILRDTYQTPAADVPDNPGWFQPATRDFLDASMRNAHHVRFPVDAPKCSKQNEKRLLNGYENALYFHDSVNTQCTILNT